MKGFPNQISDLGKLATANRVLVQLADSGEDAKSYIEYGVALLREGVLGTGHGSRQMPVEDYIARQRSLAPDRQSIQTTPRGLRELFRLMRFIDDAGPSVEITPLGRRAAELAGRPLEHDVVDFWRGVIGNIEHTDAQGTSHPYQVLLRLVARKPGIVRAKCALALAAKDDSASELDRIAALAELDEKEVVAELGVTPSNWDNAKKVLPSFAEQLGDVIRTKGSFVLADAPGRAIDAGAAEAVADRLAEQGVATNTPRAPRSSRKVTPETIGMAGIAERSSDEVPLPPPGDPQALAATNKLRADRLRRHNILVRGLATQFAEAGATLHEDPFDILAIFTKAGVLIETKTLDGSAPDERERVRDALGQLLYYEGFLTAAVAGKVIIHKLGHFESAISDSHRTWLNYHGIGVVWHDEGRFAFDDLAKACLADLLPNLF